jgi:PKD repeat protein
LQRTFVVDNVVPTVTLASVTPVNPVRGQDVAFIASPTDAGTADAIEVAWDFGDGQTIGFQSAGASAAATPSHVYTAEGTYTVTVIVRDKDGAVSTSSQIVTVSVVAMQTDPVDPTKTVLAIGGTPGDDKIRVFKQGSEGGIGVLVNSTRYDAFAPSGGMVVFTQGGRDDVHVSPAVGRAAVVKQVKGLRREGEALFETNLVNLLWKVSQILEVQEDLADAASSKKIANERKFPPRKEGIVVSMRRRWCGPWRSCAAPTRFPIGAVEASAREGKAGKNPHTWQRACLSSIRSRLLWRYELHPIHDRGLIKRFLPKLYVAYCKRGGYAYPYEVMNGYVPAMRVTGDRERDLAQAIPFPPHFNLMAWLGD